MDMKTEALIGKTLEEARKILRNARWRIMMIDDVPQLGTTDLDFVRYNLKIKDNIVTEVTFG